MFKRIYRENFKQFDNRGLEYDSTIDTYTIPNYSLNSIYIDLPHTISLHKIILDREIEDLPKKIQFVCNNNIFDEFELSFLEDNVIDLTVIFPNGIPIITPIRIYFDDGYINYNSILMEIKYINVDSAILTRYLPIYRPYLLQNISYTQFGQNFHHCLNNHCIIGAIYNKNRDLITIRDNNYRIITQNNSKIIKLEEKIFKVINNLPKFIEIRNNNSIPIIFIKEYYCYNRNSIYLKKPIENLVEDVIDMNVEDVSELNNTICPIAQDTIENNTEVIICNSCTTAFKKEGLVNWIQRGNTNCPICRNNILNSRVYLYVLNIN